MGKAPLIFNVEQGRFSVMIGKGDRHDAMALMAKLAQYLNDTAPPVPKDWRKDAAWARTSGRKQQKE